jgi:hypothetical protein
MRSSHNVPFVGQAFLPGSETAFLPGIEVARFFVRQECLTYFVARFLSGKNA